MSSPHNTLQHVAQAGDQFQIPDAGASGTWATGAIDRSPTTIQMVSLTAESRTLARPNAIGTILFLHMKTDGGDITLTVTGGYNEAGDTVLTFSDAGQFVGFVSFYDGTNYYWRMISNYGLNNASPTESNILDGLTSTATELNRMDDDFAVLATLAGTGITGGVGTVVKTQVLKLGALYVTKIYIDLTGLQAIATDLDIIGDAANPAYLGQVTVARNGTLEAIRMTCLELPAGASTDIDLYSAVEATGKKDDAIATLFTETALITAGGAWTNGAVKGATAMPAASDYLYLVNGAGANAGTYTAGKFLIEIYGY